jgi:hypothetical protein
MPLFRLAALALLLVGLWVHGAFAQTITVTTLTDFADPPFDADDVCSPTGTISDLPGTDGFISLREAIIAANNTPGPQTITFASGGTINITFDDVDGDTDPDLLPWLCGGATTINGDLDGDNVPDITLDGTGLPAGFDGLTIYSSKNTVNGLKLQNVPDTGISVYYFLPGTTITSNTISNNVLTSIGLPVVVQNDGATIKKTMIRGNTISGAGFYGVWVFTGDAPGAFTTGTMIRDNRVQTSGSVGVYLLTNFSLAGVGSKITATTIVNNEITDNVSHGILLNAVGTKSKLTGVTISGNTIARNDIGILINGGFSGATGNTVQATINKMNMITGNLNPTTGGILARGGVTSASGNTLKVVVDKNMITDHVGRGVRVTGGQNNSSNNKVTAKISNNTLERNGDVGISALGGFGSNSVDPGVSAGNTLNVTISKNTVSDQPTSGIVVLGGSGSEDGGADKRADDNEVKAVITGNTVERSGVYGVLVTGALSGLADNNEMTAQVTKNTVCQSTSGDIQVFGASPDGVPAAGTGNTAQAKIIKNTATTIAFANGVAGNTATVTQTGNVACP